MTTKKSKACFSKSSSTPLKRRGDAKIPIMALRLADLCRTSSARSVFKQLDDAFAATDVNYLRYQDDVLLLCKSIRQANGCKQRMVAVFKERRLRISYKKVQSVWNKPDRIAWLVVFYSAAKTTSCAFKPFGPLSRTKVTGSFS